jgi:error-prone DNA polymerase
MGTERFVELRVATGFSFLRGASQPEEIMIRAAALGHKRIAITDRDGISGIVRAHRAGKELGVEVLAGTELGLGLVLIASDAKSWGRLCRLLTEGKLRTGKGGIDLSLDDVARHAEGLFAIHVGALDPLALSKEREIFDDRLSIAIERTLSPFDRLRIEAAQSASVRFGVPLVVAGGVLMHDKTRKPLQDVMSCVRMGARLEEAGRRLLPNATAYLKSEAEMCALFSDFPEALARTVEIADRSTFRLSELRHEFALELVPEGETPMSYLGKLVDKGARERYSGPPPADVRAQLDHELRLIDELGFAGYFLTVWDIVRWARTRGILCQGRGSAANSAVCFVLGITAIDPVRMSLLFERFISAERGEPPDIDVDFEHERREEVLQYVFEKYGREHAGMVATVISYRGRSAFREVGKVFGLGDDQIDRLSSMQGDFQFGEDDEQKLPAYQEDPRNYHWMSPTPVTQEALKNAGLDPEDAIVRQVIHRAMELRGLPRHLGQHSGGVLISRRPLPELTTVENATMPLRTVIAWDKDDLETLGMFKIDLLALGMLSAIRRTIDLVADHEGVRYTLANIPAEDPKVYDMISDADTVGTFQVESRAQMQTLPKLKPRTFYDLVVSVAIIRPGPIQGDMVHPYLRRRAGEEPVEYPHPALEEILGKTYGVPLFQEQVMKIAIKVAGFSGGEADQLRRAIGWNSKTHIDRMKQRLVDGMLKNGVSQEYAERVFRMVQGFGNYGFPESHAASFALLAYASCYLKRHHPAAFLAGLLNSQPMGFYAPNTLVQDALRHGVEARPISIVRSGWDATLEEGDARAQKPISTHAPRTLQPAVRLGLRQVRGMSEAIAERILKARTEAPFSSVADLVARAQIPRNIAQNLATSGALAELEPEVPLDRERREALWKVAALPEASSMFSGIDLPGGESGLPPMSEEEILAADYHSTGLSARTHPMALLREEMRAQGIASFEDLQTWPDHERIRVAGLATTRQRPGTASGVVFITLEDEFGHMNLVIFAHVFERFRALAKDSDLLVAVGRVERTQKVINVIVERLEPLVRESMRPKGRYDRFMW